MTRETFQEARLGQENILKGNQFVTDISQYNGSSERVIGLQKLQENELMIPTPTFILVPNAFEEYKNHGMTAELQAEVFDAFRQIRQKNPDRGVFLGWRTVMPGGELPSGPRTAAITDEQTYLAEVEKFWQFAIKQGFDVPGAEITLVLHPFIHAAEPAIKETPFFQWPGGDVVPLADGRILVRSMWGPDEAVHGYPSDKYTVRITRRKTSVEKSIPLKTQTLIARTGSQYEEVEIPPAFQTKQVLKDSQVVQIAEACQAIKQQFGSHRLEWICQEEGMIFRECAPYEEKVEDSLFLENELIQPVIFIASEEDIARITPPSSIVYLPPELFRRRMVASISTLLASHAKRENIGLVILSHGSIASQHMVRRFRDFRQSVIFIENEQLKDGETVRVFINPEGLLQWQRVEEKKELEIIDLEDIDRMLTAAQKARNLSLLREQGISVPEGFYLYEGAFKQHLVSLNLNQMVEKLATLNGEARRQKCAEVQRRIIESSLPASVVEEVEKKLKEFPNKNFAVRSAELHEDGVVAQAGLFESYLNVPMEQVAQKILECWASGFSYHTIEYLKTVGIAPAEIEMAVIIQEMIKGKGGVIYTGKNITISGGTSADQITAGTEEKSHQLVIEKATGDIVGEKFSPDNIILSQKEVKQLITFALKTEEFFGQHQDIEWAINPEGKIYILQARPLSP